MVDLLDKKPRNVICIKSNSLLKKGQIYRLVDCGFYGLYGDLVDLAEFPEHKFDARLLSELKLYIESYGV